MAAGGQSNTKKSSERSSSAKKSGEKQSKTKQTAKNTAGTGRQSSGRKTSGSRQTGSKSAAGRKNQLQDEIMVLIAFACAVILILSNFNMAGSVGRQIKWFMFGMIGVAAYIFPFIMAATLIFLVSNRNLIAVARIKTAAVYVLTIVLSAIWQRLGSKPVIADTSIGEFFTYSAEHKSGGGLMGGLLCKLLSPLGLWGSMVVLVILAIICIILITEKSFIRGVLNVKDSGSRMVHAAKQDYDMYREHSRDRFEQEWEGDKEPEETEEEYLQRRRAQKEAKHQEKMAKKAAMLEKKRAEEERRSHARMNKKALGVTSDTQLPRENALPNSIDLHEITVDLERHDEYSDDIYEPEAASHFSAKKTASQQMASQQDFEWQVPSQQETYEAAHEEEIQNYTQKTQESLAADVAELMQEIPEEQPETVNAAQTDVASEHIPEPVQAGAASEHMPEPAQAGAKAEDVPVQEMSSNEKKDKHENYVFPPLSLLSRGKNKAAGSQERENRNTAMRLQQTLQNFGVKVTITDISCGPSVTRYELQPEQGVKVSKIVSLSDDIKLNLAAADIRIEAPIPGKAAIGIEVPNKEAGSVSLRELLETDTFQGHPSPISFAAGKDIAGKTIVADIAKMPHLLIAGATGSGKSVCINTIIMSIIYKAHPDDVKMIMVDPKVVELSVYNGIPHLLIPVVTDPKKASGALNWAVAEMTDRYKKFAQMNVRDLKGYNAKIEKTEVPEGGVPLEKMPQIVIIIDELADLMMVAPGEVEDAICRLAQLARAAGIHLVIATQRPSVNVITGLIKANVPSRIAFSVSSGVDSRTIIDMNGAEKLLGKGDMLFFPSGYPKPVRVQGAFVSDEEVGKVVDFLKEHASEEVTYNEEITNTISAVQTQAAQPAEGGKDPYFADAGRFVIGKEKGSIGMLQRYYKIGFNRAGRIMDQLAEAGVVGPELGTKPRKVEMTLEEFEEYLRKSNIQG